MKDRRVLDDRQAPLLLKPISTWEPPTSLPDVRGMRVAIDTETKDDGLARSMGPGWPYGLGYIAGISIAWGSQDQIYVPVQHPESTCFPKEQVINWISSILEHNEAIFHNILYDMGWMRESGVGLWPARAHDTQFMAVLLDENHDSYSLDNCCHRAGIAGKDEALLDDALASYGVPLINGSRRHGIWRLPAAYVGPYAGQDARATLDLAQRLLPLIETQGLTDAYQTEIQLTELIYHMRRRGIRISQDAAGVAQDEFRKQRDVALKTISDKTLVRATMADMMSPEALARIFDAEGVPYPRTPKSGQPSFQRDWLESQEHWLPGLVRQARRMNDMAEKFVGNYILGFSHLGRIHAEIHQLRDGENGTRTFRFSYANPPLQQMPARYDEDDLEEEKLIRAVRSIFLPEDGELWGALDYCFSEDTEILTESGFVPFPLLKENDLCAQVDPTTLKLSYVVPLVRQVVPYTGTMVHITGGKGGAPGSVDLLVTPNHRCLVYDKQNNWSIIRAEDWTNQISYGLGLAQLGAAVHEPAEPISEHPDNLRLAVCIQADAAIRGGTIRWRLGYDRKIQRLHDMLQRMGIPYRHESAGAVRPGGVDNKSTTIVDTNDVPYSVWNWITQDTKTFSENMLRLRKTLRLVVIDEVRHWDGSRADDIGGAYSSTNIANVDVIHRLAVTSGLASNYSGVYKTPYGKKDFAHTTWRNTDRTRAHRRAYPEYKGTVYCVTMPLSTVVVRRNGRVMVTGQSQQEPRLAVHYASVSRQRGADDAIDYYTNNPKADFHRMVADMAGIDRWSAKIINLALMYGMGVDKLIRRLRIRYPNLTDEEGDELLKKYHAKVPWVRGLSNFCSNRAQSRGVIRLIDGAACHFDNWAPRGMKAAGARIEVARQRWEGSVLERVGTHKAMNRLVQGSAARQTKKAMLMIHKAGLVPLLQMHDEIDISCATEKDSRMAQECMLTAVETLVPMKVDAEHGTDWGHAKYAWKDAVKVA